jgi:hypothetical protein
MTLTVNVYIEAENGTMQEVFDPPEGGSELAGFEGWRKTVWGSEAVRSLGARFFPQLADSDLYVCAKEMPAFIEECALLRANLALICRSSGASKGEYEETVSFRLANIEAAATRALSMGACVVVW